MEFKLTFPHLIFSMKNAKNAPPPVLRCQRTLLLFKHWAIFVTRQFKTLRNQECYLIHLTKQCFFRMLEDSARKFQWRCRYETLWNDVYFDLAYFIIYKPFPQIFIFSPSLTGIPLSGDPRCTDGIVQSSHPGPSLSAWDLNSPYSSGLLLAAEQWPGVRW